MFSFDLKQSRLILVLITIIVILIGFNVYREFIPNSGVVTLGDSNLLETEDKTVVNAIDEQNTSEVADTPQENVYIMAYVAGQVRNPGVVELPIGSRLSDAVEAAGGLLEDADLLRINLAVRLKDEGMYIIPKIGEDIPELLQTFAQEEEQSDGKININTADKALLETLPGIGPSRAQGIIDHRERNGNFQELEDIKDVSGIGDKIFDGLRDFISVN